MMDTKKISDEISLLHDYLQVRDLTMDEKIALLDATAGMFRVVLVTEAFQFTLMNSLKNK